MLINTSTDVVLLEKNEAIEQLAQSLGFSKVFFLGQDFVHPSGEKKIALLQDMKKAQQRKLLSVYKSSDPETLRFVLEKTPVDMVYGLEQLYERDSFHYPKSGLDHILCKIAAERGKTIAFSFSELLNAREKAVLLRRMAFNIRLCTKYKVKMFFGSFTQRKEEMRSRKDLETFFRLLEKMRF
ncbi:MAG TPA: hypothetical protein VJC21_05710 [Candidatus Nanoarchaeia archaeon]|nr:hypothetical protein [Candidatus Nanoarchaeia archaeon]